MNEALLVSQGLGPLFQNLFHFDIVFSVVSRLFHTSDYNSVWNMKTVKVICPQELLKHKIFVLPFIMRGET